MPRTSNRIQHIQALALKCSNRIKIQTIRILFNWKDDIADMVDEALWVELNQLLHKRYIYPRVRYRPRRHSQFADDLENSSLSSLNGSTMEAQQQASASWLTKNEFIKKYRTTRPCFKQLVALIKDHEIFKHKEGKSGRKQAPVEHQLMVLLSYLGTEGSGASNDQLRQIFSVGSGTTQLYRDRCVIAIRSCLRQKAITWPDVRERMEMSARIFRKYGFPNCIGIVDGTLFPLAFKPQRSDAPDFSGRKFGYSISTLVVCDDKRRIRYYQSGWAGSAHDNRVFDNSDIGLHPEKFFDEKQYILGDSAYTPRPSVVSAYKKLPNRELPRHQELFNRKLARLRIISEHTIGVLKARFPWLRNIRHKLKEDGKTFLKMLLYIDACVILHNLFLNLEPETAITDDMINHDDVDEWIDENELSDDDDDSNETERINYAYPSKDDEVNQPVPSGSKHSHRRTVLLNYFREVDYRFI